MTAPSVVLLILVVLSSCEVVVGDTLSIVVVEVVVGDTLSIVVMVEVVVGGDCASIAAFNIVSYNPVSYFYIFMSHAQTVFTCWLTHNICNFTT